MEISHEKKLYILVILSLLILAHGCNLPAAKPSSENTNGNTGNLTIHEENEPPEDLSGGASSEPEKVPPQLAVGEWRSVGSGEVELIRGIKHTAPTFTAYYSIGGTIKFDIWERTDVLAPFAVTGKGTALYLDKTTANECGAWEIAAQGVLTIDGTFLSAPDCQLWFNITETWQIPYIIKTTCSGIEPAPLTSPFVNDLIKMDYINKNRKRIDFPGSAMSERYDIYILKDLAAHETTGCEIIFEATPEW